ncbi:DUF4956 domain-containing protein [uncultured Microbacterium sp.]|uniref:DUF4956 domain-containing protein n=1 Tax=uncultured Microbacterium sp. TaxID=191216 RepID=UPI0025F3710B|nr:DUF4956 domain-containing protein [uncultured Microbacterium sp.]
MTVTALLLAAVDLAAAVALSAISFHRHRRRDLVVAFLGVNVGVLAVASVLGTAEVALGLGLGLFGVLSIIRLRSSEITQREVAYYFAALAIGLICGLPHTDLVPPSVLVALILLVLAVADHPRLLSRSRHQSVHLDRAIADEDELRAELARLLGGEVTALTVQRLDLVDDTTLVDVRYRIDPPTRQSATRAAIGEGLLTAAPQVGDTRFADLVGGAR